MSQASIDTEIDTEKGPAMPERAIATEDPAVEADDTPEVELGSPKATRRKLKPRTRIALLIIGAIALVSAAIIIFRMVTDASTYVTTNNAQIDGTQIVVNAPASGTLSNWALRQGDAMTPNEAVGRISTPSGYAQPQTIVRAPASGVVAVNNGVNGAFVAAGTQLAIAYDPNRVFVTARVEETGISEVHIGQPVDISVDAFSGTPLVGRVTEIKTGAAGVFSLFPQSNSSGNFQKVTQVIPVTVALDDTKGLALVPGMNVTVKIHKK